MALLMLDQRSGGILPAVARASHPRATQRGDAWSLSGL